jgi:hypothetical protein
VDFCGYFGSVVFQSGHELLGTFGTHFATLNILVATLANRISAHGTAVHMGRCLLCCPGFLLMDQRGIFVSVNLDRIALPCAAAYHTIHAKLHPTGRIPFDQIIFH